MPSYQVLYLNISWKHLSSTFQWITKGCVNYGGHGYRQVSHRNARSLKSAYLCSSLRLSSPIGSNCAKPMRNSEVGKPCVQHACHVHNFTPAARSSCASLRKSFLFRRQCSMNQARQGSLRCKQEVEAALYSAKKIAVRKCLFPMAQLILELEV